MTDKKTVLIVDDERALSNALKLKLEHEGIGVEIAPDGETALDLLKEKDFDIMLLDMVMPKMDGFTVLEKSKEQGTSIPTIVLSNLSQDEDIKRAKELGAIDFFIKSNIPISKVVDIVKEKV